MTVSRMMIEAFSDDLDLWERSITLPPTVCTSTWIFHGSTTLHICAPETVYIVKANKPTLSALAVFDIFCGFWEIEETQPNASTNAGTQRLRSYHRSLRMRILDALLRSKNPRQELDILLQPWLMRTLCLHSHDSPSREAFNAVKRPTYLTEEGKRSFNQKACPLTPLLNSAIEKTIGQRLFKEYIYRFTYQLVAENPFQWVHGRRAWEFLELEITSDPQIHQKQVLKGVFVSNREKLSGYACSIRKKSNFLRQESIDAASISRLSARRWVNDEVINGYLNLFDSKASLLVLNTFFYTLISRKGPLRSEKIIAYLGSKGPSSETTIQAAIERYKQIIIPINLPNEHWLIAVLDVTKTEVIFMDSLPEKISPQSTKGLGQAGGSRVEKIMKVFKDRLGLGLEWTYAEADVPVQRNPYDCGIFCTQFIKFFYFQRELPKWNESDVLEVRDMVTMELYEQTLRWFTS